MTGATCTESWKSSEFLLRDAAWLASQQTGALYGAILMALIVVAGTGLSAPRAGQWRRRWKSRSVPVWALWVPVLAVACLLPFVPHLGAETALEDAPRREIFLYHSILALLFCGLLALLPYARLRAVGVTALSLGLAVAFTQATFINTFVAEQSERVVLEEGPTEVRFDVESSLSEYQQAALDRLSGFYSASAIVAVMLLVLAVLARLLLGGSLFATSHSEDAGDRPVETGEEPALLPERQPQAHPTRRSAR